MQSLSQYLEILWNVPSFLDKGSLYECGHQKDTYKSEWVPSKGKLLSV